MEDSVMDSKTWDKIKNQELMAWLQSDAAEARELIVQVQTPPRQITMKCHHGGRVQPEQVPNNDTQARQKAIDDRSSFPLAPSLYERACQFNIWQGGSVIGVDCDL